MVEYICYACNTEGKGRRRKRGSGKAELWIYLILMVPGPFYSVWRRCWLKRECTNCGMDTVVKVTSEQGQIAKRRLDMELGILPTKKTQTPAAAPIEAAPVIEKREPKKPVDPEQF